MAPLDAEVAPVVVARAVLVGVRRQEVVGGVRDVYVVEEIDVVETPEAPAGGRSPAASGRRVRLLRRGRQALPEVGDHPGVQAEPLGPPPDGPRDEGRLGRGQGHTREDVAEADGRHLVDKTPGVL